VWDSLGLDWTHNLEEDSSPQPTQRGGGGGKRKTKLPERKRKGEGIGEVTAQTKESGKATFPELGQNPRDVLTLDQKTEDMSEGRFRRNGRRSAPIRMEEAKQNRTGPSDGFQGELGQTREPWDPWKGA